MVNQADTAVSPIATDAEGFGDLLLGYCCIFCLLEVPFKGGFTTGDNASADDDWFFVGYLRRFVFKKSPSIISRVTPCSVVERWMLWSSDTI